MNARIWTGEKNGTEVIEADILLDKGIIKGIGHIGRLLPQFDISEGDAIVYDVKGSWVVPGCVCVGSRPRALLIEDLQHRGYAFSPRGRIFT